MWPSTITRVWACGLVLADETAGSACVFVLAALRYYKGLGVKIERVMTDNGSANKLRRFARLLRRLGVRHLRTRPYSPRTNIGVRHPDLAARVDLCAHLPRLRVPRP